MKICIADRPRSKNKTRNKKLTHLPQVLQMAMDVGDHLPSGEQTARLSAIRNETLKRIYKFTHRYVRTSYIGKT